jgi:hypothetical protein
MSALGKKKAEKPRWKNQEASNASNVLSRRKAKHPPAGNKAVANSGFGWNFCGGHRLALFFTVSFLTTGSAIEKEPPTVTATLTEWL